MVIYFKVSQVDESFSNEERNEKSVKKNKKAVVCRFN